MTIPSTTIVVSNYNYARYLCDCLKSCWKQAAPCQIIVVDDASTDSSWIETVSFVDSHPGVVGVRLNANSGGNARGKNVGICLSKTKYVVCLDSDDMLLPDSVFVRECVLEEQAVDFVHAHAFRITGAYDYHSAMVAFKEGRLSFNKSASHYRKISTKSADELSWVDFIENSTVLCKRSLYERFGLFDEKQRWKIDKEMWHRFIRGKAKKFFMLSGVSFYRRHSEQITMHPDRKNVKLVEKTYADNIAKRSVITPENTALICTYDIRRFVGDVVGRGYVNEDLLHS